jgi:tyrosyl-tRNA synthetase
MAFANVLKNAGLVETVSEGNRAIDQGGARIDGEAIKDRAHRLNAGEYLLQVGKRRFARVTLTIE